MIVPQRYREDNKSDALLRGSALRRRSISTPLSDQVTRVSKAPLNARDAYKLVTSIEFSTFNFINKTLIAINYSIIN